MCKKIFSREGNSFKNAISIFSLLSKIVAIWKEIFSRWNICVEFSENRGSLAFGSQCKSEYLF
jgi:hypothetical protein